MATATTNPRSAVLFDGAHNTVNQTRATLGTANCYRLAKEHVIPSMAPKVFAAVAGEDFVRVAPRQMAYLTLDGAIFDDDLRGAGLHFVGTRRAAVTPPRSKKLFRRDQDVSRCLARYD